MGKYNASSNFIDNSNRRARGVRRVTGLDDALRPYAQGARVREEETGEKPICFTCRKEKTITKDFAICWDCARERKGGDMSE